MNGFWNANLKTECRIPDSDIFTYLYPGKDSINDQTASGITEEHTDKTLKHIEVILGDKKHF